jgi:hypothetical protein
MDRTIPSRTMTVRAKQAFGSDPRLCYRTAVPAHTLLSTKPTSGVGRLPLPFEGPGRERAGKASAFWRTAFTP